MSADNKIGEQAFGPASSRRTTPGGIFGKTHGGFAPDWFAKVEIDGNARGGKEVVHEIQFGFGMRTKFGVDSSADD